MNPERFATVTAWGLVAVAGLGLLSLIVGDRLAATAWLLYVPAFWIGLGSLMASILSGATRPPWPRIPRRCLAALGLAALIWDGGQLVGFGGAAGGPPEAGDLVAIHWNVQWGGGRPRRLDRWMTIVEVIAARDPDLVLLSESPPDAWVKVLLDRLGPEWTSVGVENAPGARDWYKLVILSKRPITSANPVRLVDGSAIEAAIGADHFLLVDRPSDPRRWRIPFLRSVAAAINAAQRRNTPYTLVAGDFNCPARSVGFGPLQQAGDGYLLASRRRFGWRPTWPAFLPVLDIDHVLIRRDRPIRIVRYLKAPAGDHLGQLVTLAPPP